MGFFQTFVICFAGFTLVGAALNRWFPQKTLMVQLYGLIGCCIGILIIWTIVQMIFGLPQIDDIFPITAILLGLMFSIGIDAAYQTLKARKKRK